MKCLSCNHETVSGFKFCPECGAVAPTPTMGHRCKFCGHSSDINFRFCTTCGAENKSHKPIVTQAINTFPSVKPNSEGQRSRFFLRPLLLLVSMPLLLVVITGALLHYASPSSKMELYQSAAPVIASSTPSSTATPKPSPSPQKTRLEQFQEKTKVNKTGIDFKYDQKGNLGVNFILYGEPELDDYYNYGFSDLEETFFCIRIRYENEYWYLYAHRESFPDLYNDLLNQKVTDLYAVCKVEEYQFEDGQRNMAMIYRVSYL